MLSDGDGTRVDVDVGDAVVGSILGLRDDGTDEGASVDEVVGTADNT